jgi:phosphoglucosamine mutase
MACAIVRWEGVLVEVGPAVFEELGGAIEVISAEPSGMNINDQCGSTAPEKLVKGVLERGADLGIAWDGDADRIIAVDEKGIVRDGDYLMAILAFSLHEKKKLSKETVVATQMSNLGLERALKSKNIQLIRTEVGDRFVVEEMRKHQYNFGGEQSGHLIFLDDSTTGDGILSALHLVSAIQEKQRSLFELSEVVQKIPQILLNVKVKEKRPFETLTHTSAKIKEIEKLILGKGGKGGKGEKGGAPQGCLPQGRLLVRYSGTENLARVMIEGENEMEIEKLAYDLAECLRGELS